jgi:hypothetical protein
LFVDGQPVTNVYLKFVGECAPADGEGMFWLRAVEHGLFYCMLYPTAKDLNGLTDYHKGSDMIYYNIYYFII